MDDDNDVGTWRYRASRRDAKRARRKPYVADVSVRSTRDLPTAGGILMSLWRHEAEVWLPSGETLSCRLPASLIAREPPAPGDDVVITIGDNPTVLRLGPRRTSLCRGSPHSRHHHKVVVANVDWVGIVSSASDPPLRPRLIDRYLLAVHHGGAVPIVVVNKIDQADEEDRAWVDEVVVPWERAGLAVIRASAATGEGLPALIDAMGDGRGAFVGHSGVGKSSLVAALGSEALAGELADHGRGRHTTTTSRLHRLPSGATVIDTPGVRQFAPWAPTRADLRATFTDLEELAVGCGFSGCTHLAEPDCAVLEAVEEGTLPEARWQSYRRLFVDVDR
ncbi:MAG: ribosome small subunit-dependent GTPase A [Alphaproteobacteria bacterium]|nr:ribosome small subunit-dependent GTPase A [Alphaproteobacteria bacterium]